MPYDVALNYAYRALRIVSSNGIPWEDQLDWMERKDKITRGVMCGYVRQKWPGQEALARALVETASDWTIVKGSEVVGTHDTVVAKSDDVIPPKPRTTPRLRGFRKSTPNNSKVGRMAAATAKARRSSKIGKVATTTRNKEKLCGAFNSKRGCVRREKDCPQWGKHRCAYIIKEDGACIFATDHGAAHHVA